MTLLDDRSWPEYSAGQLAPHARESASDRLVLLLIMLVSGAIGATAVVAAILLMTGPLDLWVVVTIYLISGLLGILAAGGLASASPETTRRDAFR
jgi:hypothetical protein